MAKMQAFPVTRSFGNILNWGKYWQMLINLNQCKVLYVGKGNLYVEYSMESVSLEGVKEETSKVLWLQSFLKQGYSATWLSLKPKGFC